MIYNNKTIAYEMIFVISIILFIIPINFAQASNYLVHPDEIITYTPVSIKHNSSEEKLFFDGMNYFKMKQFDNAIKAFDQLTKESPNCAEAYAYLSQSKYYKNISSTHPIADPSILQLDDKAIELEPNNPLFHCFRALHSPIYYVVEYDLEKALALNPKLSYAYYCKGIVSEIKKDDQAAIDNFTKAIDLEPSDDIYYMDRGDIYYQLDDYAKAMEDYKMVLKLNPNNSDAYFSIGDINYSLENYDEALNGYSKAIEIDPNYTDAYYSRGMIYFQKGNYYKAANECSKSIALDNECADAYYWRGWSMYELGHYTEAIHDFSYAINYYEEPEPDAYRGRALAYKSLGDNEMYHININLYNKYNKP